MTTVNEVDLSEVADQVLNVLDLVSPPPETSIFDLQPGDEDLVFGGVDLSTVFDTINQWVNDTNTDGGI